MPVLLDLGGPSEMKEKPKLVDGLILDSEYKYVFQNLIMEAAEWNNTIKHVIAYKNGLV
jgi:hypothetical protein